MTAAELNIELSRAEVVSGESLALKATLKNTSGQPLAFSPGPLSPVRYELLGADGERVASVSQRQRVSAMMLGSAPPMPEDSKQLAPDATHDFREDPALYAMLPLPAGDYQLLGKLACGETEISSQPLAVTVQAARVSRWASLFCPLGGSLSLAFDHEDAAGERWLFQQDTENTRIDSGVYYRRDRLLGSGPLQDLVLAAKTSSESFGRWTAWLRGGSLGAQLSWASSSIKQLEPLPLELAQPRLVRPGFQAADGSGLFLVAGLEQGRAVVQPFRVTRDGISAGARLPLGSSLPEALAARYEPEEGGLRLVWAERHGALCRVMLRKLSAEGEAVGADPCTLVETEAPLVALQLAAYPAAGASDALHLLLGPRIERHHGYETVYYSYLQQPLSGDAATQRRLLPPEDPVDAWAIADRPVGDPARLLVLAASKGRLLCAHAESGSDWRLLKADMAGCEQLVLLASAFGYWVALWQDPVAGLQALPAPGFRMPG